MSHFPRASTTSTANAAASRSFAPSSTPRRKASCASSFSMLMPNGKRKQPSLADDRQQLGVFLGSFRRQRPFLTQGFFVLGVEERRFHPSVDDVPGKDSVFAPIAKD